MLAAAALGVALLALVVGVLALWRAHEAKALARQPRPEAQLRQMLDRLEAHRPPDRPPQPPAAEP
jgi:hypothetical protein